MKTSESMFQHLKKKWMAFYMNPTEEKLIDTLFPMYHLREWICQDHNKKYLRKAEDQRTREEKIDEELETLTEFKIIQSLCNHSKHYILKKSNKVTYDTVVLEKARVGLMRCTDPLNITHYVVDGKDIRDVFIKVYNIYQRYFEHQLK